MMIEHYENDWKISHLVKVTVEYGWEITSLHF